MLVIGLLLLAAAVVVGVAGVAANTGSAHQLVNAFSIFGYHVHGSAGKLFLAGFVVGAVGLLGLIMILNALRRNAALRRELFRFRHDERSRRRAAATARPAPAAQSAPAKADQPTEADQPASGKEPTQPVEAKSGQGRAA